MILFTKKGCQKCDYVKQQIPAALEIITYDIETPEGLAELAYLELVPLAEKALPILVKSDNGVITGAINIKQEIQRMI
jgi:hypothetical protein